MPDLIRHPVKYILDSGFRRNDHIELYCCLSNKMTRPISTSVNHTRVPSWLNATVPAGADQKLQEMRQLLSQHHLNSVCQSARCPNIAHCFSKNTVTFMILGDVCTRNCLFCGVTKGLPRTPDPEEAARIAEAVVSLKLRHAVITSVTRDDLRDGGADHFVKVVEESRVRNSYTVLELLIPDFQGCHTALKAVVDSKPDIIGHNMETVPRIFRQVRKEADFQRSLALLGRVKDLQGSMLTKSGFMVGLGETREEVTALLAMLRDAGCDIVTIGQYLRPSSVQMPVIEYIPPSTFEQYREKAMEMGFKAALSGPLVRSSFNASELLDSIEIMAPRIASN
jgi:lipoic acid synthetase